jgi:hypothetical protein
MEHNLAIFEMLKGEYESAVEHFESAITFWISKKLSLFEKIDTWNLFLALDMIDQNEDLKKQKLLFFNSIGRYHKSIELDLFLIHQFADISDLFGDKSASICWLERGLKESVKMENLFDIALYFEARLGSFSILRFKEQFNDPLSRIQKMRQKYCTIFGDSENFLVVLENNFYLLRKDPILSQ